MHPKTADQIRKGVVDSYGAIAGEFDQTRVRPWPEFEGFSAYVRKGDKVLDLGCGNGRLSEILKPKNVDYLGMDNNSALIEKARQRFPEAEFQLGDMVDLELPDRCFDVVFSVAAFHHIPSQRLRAKAVSQIRRILKDRGILILTSWNLFQWKYAKAWARSLFSFLTHFGIHYAWNDLWIPWAGFPLKRYYHAFLPKELLRSFPKDEWSVEEFYFTKKGARVKFWQSFNLCLVLRKIHGKND
jgi:SAM-dependent methyltransferase